MPKSKSLIQKSSRISFEDIWLIVDKKNLFQNVPSFFVKTPNPNNFPSVVFES